MYFNDVNLALCFMFAAFRGIGSAPSGYAPEVFHFRVFHPCYLVPRFPLPHFPLPRFQRPLVLNYLVIQWCYVINHCHLWMRLSTWVFVCCLGWNSKWSAFFRSFNSVYQKCCRANRETVVLQLVQSFCKPHLLYATECLQLSHTAVIKLKSAWFSLCFV